MSTAISISGLVKTFGPTRALDGLDLDVATGEVHGFLGPNGAGKSTTIRVLLGLLRADSGTASLLGGDPWRDAAELHRRLAYVPGDVSLWPNLTGGEVIDLLSRLRGGLDVPKERFVSFAHCARDPDPSLPVLWAGHDHLARARALAAWYVERKDTDGWAPERLRPLLAGLLELVPWLRQWHNDLDADTGLRMGDFFAGYVEEQARELGLTLDDLHAWSPPAPARGRRGRRAAA